MDNRRNTIVINKPFQYQHSLFIAALSVLLVNGFLILRMLLPGEQPALELSTQTSIGLAVVEFILIAGIWYGSLKASHRIAGPVHVFAREITRLGEGDLSARIRLREKDLFQSEAEQMNQGIAALGARIEVVKALSDQLQQTQSTGGDPGPILQKLGAELSAFTLGTKH
jgi:methyl-accepting chemotaxis protein